MQLFSVPIFLLVFRETIETSIIVSVLLVFLKQTLASPSSSSPAEAISRAAATTAAAAAADDDELKPPSSTNNNNNSDSPQQPVVVDLRVYNALRRQILLGTVLGFILCIAIGGAVIGVFYTLGVNKWESSGAELNWEGAFCLLASVIISVVGAALLRVGRMKEKWRGKMIKAMEGKEKNKKSKGGRVAGGEEDMERGETVERERGWWVKCKAWMERYVMFILPFVTVLREGVEAIVFVAGVSFAAPATSIPIPAIVGVIVGSLVGVVLYKFGSSTKLQLFLVLSTSLLYLVAAGLFSRAIWALESQQWAKAVGSDAIELGSGPGSYDIDKSVWHVDCCSPQVNGGGGWGIFNAIFGWTNSATYGSVIGYDLYWLVVIVSFLVMRYREVKGKWPLIPQKTQVEDGSEKGSLFGRLSWKKGRA
ncbi:iron permease FTR1/Fip1/EfeU [Neurospora hispaniola]|uniref:Iron permease FTR1/Fip1/EfeU n=1 Tax=Neurospora hispaniola TaxID=588809 RepID=A0AAJ0MPX0_9PEZI|nr:iron permease FTR1/Fip1/EfeU [Neurospora hispaniola]